MTVWVPRCKPVPRLADKASVTKTPMGPQKGVMPAVVAFKDLPQDWDCPICGVGKNKFTANDKVVAGFAENQTYGLGTNSWTEGQKLAIIYGSIAFFVFVFLSGYLLG